MRQFALGAIYAVPSGANPTTVPIAIVKSADVEFKQTKKPLRGQYKAPIDFGDGPLDISVKIANAEFRAAIVNMMISGSTNAAGSVSSVAGESATVPTTPFQVTVANGATMQEDGGVLDLTSGIWLTRVAAGPTTGQYSVNTVTGLYTFAAADVTHKLQIVYAYTTSAVGNTTSYLNQVMGPSTPYALRLYNMYRVGNSATLRPVGLSFPAAHFTSLSIGFKAEDWAESNIQADIGQDLVSQTVFSYYVGE